jgi:hypothetical protein
VAFLIFNAKRKGGNFALSLIFSRCIYKDGVISSDLPGSYMVQWV